MLGELVERGSGWLKGLMRMLVGVRWIVMINSEMLFG